MLGRSCTTTILCASLATLLGLPHAAGAEEPPAAPAAPAAPAPALQWKLYGFLNAELEQVGATGGATRYGTRLRVSDGNSRLGFSGSYPIYEAVKALWQIEGSLGSFEQGGTNDKGAASAIVSRNTFVGVEEGRVGRLIVGYNDSVYRSLVGSGGELGGNLGLSVLGLDLWNNTSAQVSGNPDSIFSRGEARYKNSLHFVSAERMVRFGASYGIDEAVSGGRHRDRFALAVRLKAAGFQLGAGFDRQDNTGANTDQLQQGLGLRTDAEPGVATYYYKLVATYTAPTRTFVGLGWERSNYGFSQFIPPSTTSPTGRIHKGTMTQDAMLLSVAQPFGAFTAMASVGWLSGLHGSLFFPASKYAARQYSLGVKYDLGDHFASYVYFTRIDNEAQQNVNLGQAPLYSNGAGTSDAYLAPGDKPHAVGLGLLARF